MIHIFADTTSSLTIPEYEQYGIKPIPLSIIQGEVAKQELFEISYDEFYKSQRAGVKYTTTQPSPEIYQKCFKPIIEAGDEAIAILLSGEISNTVNTANIAVETMGTDKISIVDSKATGFSMISMALKAKEMASAGASRAEIVQALEDMRNRTRIYIIVESLRYLYEGGRLSGAQALIGSVIQIKPIIWFDNQGKLVTFEKARTLKTAKSRTFELVQECIPLGVEKIALHYGDNREEALEYTAKLEEITGSTVPVIQISPVLGAHVGPDILGVVVITKQ
jgi:DegV family protein with EDD domain